MGRLAGKTALVTGATRGIGRVIVDRFVAEGASVLAVARSVPAADRPVPPALLFHAADVASGEAAAGAVALMLDRFGRLDILVNNAGISIEKPLEETSEAEWDRLMGVNLKGAFLLCRHAIPAMRRQGGGVIINLGSVSGLLADAGMPAYNASKAGLHGLTRSIAVDHGADGIRCNAICPGWIETEMLEQSFRRGADPAQARRQAIARHPVGRLGRPEDVAALALWLASDESAFASGQLFTLDGGLTAQSPIAP